MLTVEAAKGRIQDLEAELSQVENDLREAHGQLDQANQRRDAAYTKAERSPTPQAEREASQALAETRRLTDLVQRKKTAVTAIQSDLTKARNQLIFAQKAAAVLELEGIYSEIVAVAARLDVNMADFDAWGQLKVLVAKGNTLYLTTGISDSPMARGPFADLSIVVSRVMDGFRIKLDNALNPGLQRGTQVQFATVAAAAELEPLGRRIASLRRVHIADELVGEPVLA